MWESLFNKFTGLQVCNFIKKWLKRKCFPWILRNSLVHLFYRTPFVAASVPTDKINQRTVSWCSSQILKWEMGLKWVKNSKKWLLLKLSDSKLFTRAIHSSSFTFISFFKLSISFTFSSSSLVVVLQDEWDCRNSSYCDAIDRFLSLSSFTSTWMFWNSDGFYNKWGRVKVTHSKNPLSRDFCFHEN